MITVYGSNTCYDTLSAITRMAERGIDFNFVNITGSIGLLKEFLYMRDTNPLYDDVHGKNGIGIPTFKLEDGTLTRDFNAVMKAAGKKQD